jgi:hypothetical protein
MTSAKTRLDRVQVLRRFLLALVAFGIVGTFAELLLTDHYQKLTQ